MKNRKSFDRAEKNRGIYFFTGLTIALAAVIVAFQWETEYTTVLPESKIDIREVQEIAEVTIIRSQEKQVSVSENEKPVQVVPDEKPVIPEEPKKDPVTYTPPDVVFVDSAGPEPIDFSEKMPSFPGGIDNLYEYLRKNIKYPEYDLKYGIKGTVVVAFVVDEDGNILNPHIRRSVSRNLDEEALRVVSSMPKWEAGEHRHKRVKVRVNLPIKFEIGK